MKNSLSVLFFITVFLISTSISAQGLYEVQFVHHHSDCIKNIIYVDIEVKAKSPNTTFFIADQNYRFSFDKNVLSNPKIEKELEVSGSSNSDYNTSFYNPHHLQGSVENVVSYNVVLTGGKGYPITDTEWTPVGRMSFDVTDIDQPIELTWHDSKPENFPPTFISEKTSSGKLQPASEHLYSNFSAKEFCIEPRLEQPAVISELFPNPVSNDDGKITIELMNEFTTVNPQLVVSTIDGALVAEQDVNLTDGFNSIQYNIQNLPTGIYLIQINDKEWSSKTIKFVKMD